MMLFRTLFSLCLIFLMSISITNAQKNGTFDINSQTKIVDTNGSPIPFDVFSKMKPGEDYGALLPDFNSDGKLKQIKIHLNKPLSDILSASMPAPVSVSNYRPSTTTTTTSSASTRPAYGSSSSSSYSPSTGSRVVSRVPDRKFKFTTAGELSGLKAPFYSEKGLDGTEYSSNTMYGKVVVMKFWFVKCGPCLEEIPELNKLVARFENNPDVKFIAPATDEVPAVKRFMEKRPGFRYEILPDAIDVHGDFKVAGYPTHLIIMRNGVVGRVITGKHTRLADALGAAIEEALLLGPTDKSLEEIPQPLYKPGMYIVAEEGYPLDKKQYLKKLASGQYKIFKKVKMDGSEQIYLKKNIH